MRNRVDKIFMKGSYTRVIKKVLSLSKKGRHNRDSFSIFFNIVPLNINTLGPAMFMHCNPLTEDSFTLIQQAFLFNTDSFQTGDQEGVI